MDIGKMKVFSGRSRGSLRRLGIVHDILVASLSMTVAMTLAWGFAPLASTWQIWALIGAYTLVATIAFPFFSLNSGAWRYASLFDLLSIVKAATFINLAFLLGNFLLFRGSYLPRTTIITSWFIMIVGLGGPRLAYRLMKERALSLLPLPSEDRSEDYLLSTLLYGFNDNADLFIRNVRRMRRQNLIVGIVDNRPKNRRRQLHGVKVLGSLDDIKAIKLWADRCGTPIGELLVTATDISPQELSDLVARVAPLQIVVKRLPDINRAGIVDRNAPIEPLPVSLEDLLGRKEVNLDTQEVEKLIRDRIVVVTGAGGSIGSELVRQIAPFAPSKLVLIDNSEFALWSIGRRVVDDFPDLTVIERLVDVRQDHRLRALFAELSPDVIFHAAALKHVPMVEENPLEGIDTNLLGTRNVANAAIAANASAFVMVSTDKAVNPSNVMGATKRAAEAYCQALDVAQSSTRFITVRFGNVLGSTGSVIPLFRAQLQKRGPLTVTDPQITRFFMTIPEASRLILHAASQGMNDLRAKGQIYVLDMGKPIRIAELAERLIQLAGLRPHIDIKIKYIGLRRGEKLFEELFAEGETREETGSKGLMFARSRVTDAKFLARGLETLETAIRSSDETRSIEILKRIVPEFSGRGSTTPELASPAAKEGEVLRIASSVQPNS